MFFIFNFSDERFWDKISHELVHQHHIGLPGATSLSFKLISAKMSLHSSRGRIRCWLVKLQSCWLVSHVI